MLIVTVQVNAPSAKAQGVKEQIAQCLERWGDTKVISVEERPQPAYKQMRIGEYGNR